MDTAMAPPKPGERTSPPVTANTSTAKPATVARLLSALSADLAAPSPTLTPAERTAALERLKICGRDPEGCDALFADSGITTLCGHAFAPGDAPSSREALRCLANALLLQEPCRAAFVRLGHALPAASRFATADTEDEFLLSRVLFLATFAPPLPAGLLDGTLPASLAAALSRHADAATAASGELTPARAQALTETLKLLFNLGHHSQSAALLPCLPALMTLLTTTPVPTPPLQGLIPHLINAPLSLPLPPSSPTLFPPAGPDPTPLDRLLALLAAATQHLDGGDDAAVVPLVTLLRRLAALSPPPAAAAQLRSLLPAPHERDAPLGAGASPAARLLRLTAAAAAPELREHVAALLFELSGSDAEAFAANVGYGYASGFLASRGAGAGSGAGVGGGAGEVDGRAVNPVTGQWVDAEPAVGDPFAGMTDGEKEREAERLFVLFERLRRTGVVDVNPVQQAVEEGRFQEMED